MVKNKLELRAALQSEEMSIYTEMLLYRCFGRALKL